MALENEKVLIFGGSGSLGRALIRRLKDKNSLHVFSRDEAKHWTIKNRIASLEELVFHVGDIRDASRVQEVVRRVNPTLIMIASALKQVDTCEVAPFESIQTNVLGVRNVCESIFQLSGNLNQLSTVLFVSTDKACAPTNVYGMSKALGEKIVTSYHSRENSIKFIAVRYGNVLESRGSIVPLFKHQIETNKDLTVTDRRMTRFIMTLDQSIDLIERSISDSNSGQIWIPKIPSMRIIDLAEIFAEKFNRRIQVIGMRPGEKLHEDLVSEPESTRTVELENHFVIENSFSNNKQNKDNDLFAFTSNRGILEKDSLRKYLSQLGIFEMQTKDFLGNDIEEIRTK
jgi:FlaA1/EpsC-like NDP-sugar epimerase